MNRNGYRCRSCRHGRPGACKGRSYRKHGCATATGGPKAVR